MLRKEETVRRRIVLIMHTQRSIQSNAVGLAIAGKQLAATYNKDNLDIIGQRIWCFTGDGCLQEGVG
jgi:hypothetical protein